MNSAISNFAQAYGTQTTGTQNTNTKKDVDAPALAKDPYSLSMEDFLTLMVKQFQNQDIENPASTSDMLNQLVQMTSVTTMNTISDAISLQYASSLVGKEVTIGVYENGTLKEIVGTVTGTGTYNGGQVVFIGDKSYSISSIMAVGRLPAKPETPEDPDKTPEHPIEKPEDPDKDPEHPIEKPGEPEGEKKV